MGSGSENSRFSSANKRKIFIKKIEEGRFLLFPHPAGVSTHKSCACFSDSDIILRWCSSQANLVRGGFFTSTVLVLLAHLARPSQFERGIDDALFNPVRFGVTLTAESLK